VLARTDSSQSHWGGPGGGGAATGCAPDTTVSTCAGWVLVVGPCDQGRSDVGLGAGAHGGEPVTGRCETIDPGSSSELGRSGAAPNTDLPDGVNALLKSAPGPGNAGGPAISVATADTGTIWPEMLRGGRAAAIGATEYRGVI
jgi:hypothetical protein